MKLFYCYSPKLKKELLENGFKYLHSGIHNKTKKTFWVFVFVFLFPCDYSNLKKLKDKLYEAISKSLLKGGEIIGENALPI